MGNKNTGANENKPEKSDVLSSSSSSRKPKFLCLHGWRTSGFILSIQTAALRANTDIDCEFIDAPYKAEGQADAGIEAFYPDLPYYEWFLKRFDEANGKKKLRVGIEDSISFIIDYMNKHGPFDGILGFSQGAGMTTRIARLFMESKSSSGNNKLFIHDIKCVILIGGVSLSEIGSDDSVVQLPSLHIMGQADFLLPQSKELEAQFDSTLKSSMLHEEGHNIPSIRTKLYPLIKSWVEKHVVKGP